MVKRHVSGFADKSCAYQFHFRSDKTGAIALPFRVEWQSSKRNTDKEAIRLAMLIVSALQEPGTQAETDLKEYFGDSLDDLIVFAPVSGGKGYLKQGNQALCCLATSDMESDPRIALTMKKHYPKQFVEHWA